MPISASSRSKTLPGLNRGDGPVLSPFCILSLMKRFLLPIFLAFLLVSCSSGQDDGTVLDIALSQEPPTLDVHVNSSLSVRCMMAGNVFERLVTLDSDGRAVPELCSSFYSENNAQSWVFKLRKGVLFHNGREMTGDDVTASLNRWIEYNSSVSSMLDGARFVQTDRYTVRIDASQPILFLPDMMAASPQSAVIYAREMLDSLDSDGLVTEYIGTGPYRFDSWARGQYVKLVRFDSYCAYGDGMDGLAGRKNAFIGTLVYHFVPDAFARTAGCETGLYDFINDMMSDDEERLSRNPDLVVSRGEEAGSVVLLFNKRDGIAKEQYIRSAVNTALDLDVLMAACYGNGGYVMHSDYMESGQKLWAVDRNDPRYDINDKEGARRILEENGYDGSAIRILSSNLSNLDRLAVALQSELEKAGFNTELTVVDWATMMDYRSDSSRWDICITAMAQVPIPSLKLFLSPDYAGWSDDETLQRMMEDFSRSLATEEAQEKWRAIQDYCYDYLPAIVCGHYLSGYLYSASLENVDESYGFYFYNSTFS